MSFQKDIVPDFEEQKAVSPIEEKINCLKLRFDPVSENVNKESDNRTTPFHFVEYTKLRIEFEPTLQEFPSYKIQDIVFLRQHENFRNVNKLKNKEIGKIVQKILLNYVNRSLVEQAESVSGENVEKDCDEKECLKESVESFSPPIQKVKKLFHVTDEETNMLIKRIDHLTGLLNRIIVFDNCIFSKAEVPILKYVTCNLDPNLRPIKLCILECEFDKCLSVLINDDSADFEALNKFLISIKKALEHLKLLSSSLQYNEEIFSDSSLRSERLLSSTELNGYLPQLWCIIRFHNVLLKQWTAEFLNYTLSHFCSRDNVHVFNDLDAKVRSTKYHIADVHRLATRLLSRWRNTPARCSEIMEFYLLIAAANTASSLYNDLLNEIVMTKCYHGSRKLANPSK